MAWLELRRKIREKTPEGEDPEGKMPSGGRPNQNFAKTKGK